MISKEGGPVTPKIGQLVMTLALETNKWWNKIDNYGLKYPIGALPGKAPFEQFIWTARPVWYYGTPIRLGIIQYWIMDSIVDAPGEAPGIITARMFLEDFLIGSINICIGVSDDVNAASSTAQSHDKILEEIL